MGKGTYTLLIKEHIKENEDAWLIEDLSGDKQIGIEIVVSDLASEIALLEDSIKQEQEKGAANRELIAAQTYLSSWLSTYRDELRAIVYLDHTHEIEMPANFTAEVVDEPSLWDNMIEDGAGGMVQDYQSALASSGSPFIEAAQAVQKDISLVK